MKDSEEIIDEAKAAINRLLAAMYSIKQTPEVTSRSQAEELVDALEKYRAISKLHQKMVAGQISGLRAVKQSKMRSHQISAVEVRDAIEQLVTFLKRDRNLMVDLLDVLKSSRKFLSGPADAAEITKFQSVIDGQFRRIQKALRT